jgi:hypothetical protein
VPVAVHVRLADAQTAAQRPPEKSFVPDFHVPWPISVYPDIRSIQQPGNDALSQRLHAISPTSLQVLHSAMPNL